MRWPPLSTQSLWSASFQSLRADGGNLEVTFVHPYRSHFKPRGAFSHTAGVRWGTRTLPSFHPEPRPLTLFFSSLPTASCALVFSLLAPRGRPLRYFHKDAIDPAKKTPPPPPVPLNPPTHPDQFASSKTNIVFNQMQLGLQVKISSQLKFIRTIMSLGESWVTTACTGSAALVTNNSSTASVAAAHLNSFGAEKETLHGTWRHLSPCSQRLCNTPPVFARHLEIAKQK